MGAVVVPELVARAMRGRAEQFVHYGPVGEGQRCLCAEDTGCKRLAREFCEAWVEGVVFEMIKEDVDV